MKNVLSSWGQNSVQAVKVIGTPESNEMALYPKTFANIV